MIVSFLEAAPTKMMERGWSDLGRAKKRKGRQPCTLHYLPQQPCLFYRSMVVIHNTMTKVYFLFKNNSILT
jgi:hypothetical protein